VVDEVRCSVDVDPCDVLDCQLVGDLCVVSSCHEVGLDVQSLRHWRCVQNVAMGRCYSRPGPTTQLRSEHVLEECPFLTESLYPTRVSGT